MRIHQENLTATDADILSGTALDTLEAGGQLDVYLISTQADGVVSITGPDNEPIAQSINPAQETRAIQPENDVPFSLVVETGGHYTIAYTEVTAATLQFLGIYRKEEDF